MSSNNVERFLASALIPIQNTDKTKYPLTPSRVKHLYLDHAAAAFLEARSRLEAQGWSTQAMAQLFRNPSRIMRMSYYLLEGSRMLGNAPPAQHELLDFLLSLVRHLKVSDPCGADRINPQVALHDALAELSPEEGAEADAAASRRFHRLAAVLRTYMDAVYLVPHDVGMEMYGPYDGPQVRYFVRDFFNLRPTALWPETAAVSATEVRLDAGYDPSVVVHFDVFNNPYVASGSYVADCRWTRIRIDGREGSPDEVEALTKQALSVVGAVVAKMGTLDEVAQAELYIRCFWLRMQRFLEAAGMEAEPSPAVKARLAALDALPAPQGAPTLDTLRTNLGL